MSRQTTLAARARGPALLVAPALGALMLALPASWWMPLFRTEVVLFLRYEVSVAGAVRSLYETDLFLCLVVVAFGMALPLAKIAALLYAWLALPCERGKRWIDGVSKIGKLAMLDVFLIAVTIVGFKGVGLGRVSMSWGFYVFAGLVIATVLLSFAVQRVAQRTRA